MVVTKFIGKIYYQYVSNSYKKLILLSIQNLKVMSLWSHWYTLVWIGTFLIMSTSMVTFLYDYIITKWDTLA